MSFIYLCATAATGTHPKSCKNALSNTFLGRSETIILPKTALIFSVLARLKAPLKLSPMTLPLDNIFCKTLPVPAKLPKDVVYSLHVSPL